MWFYFSIFNHPRPPSILFTRQSEGWSAIASATGSCPGLQAVSRNESIVKSDSTALMTAVLIGHHPGNIVHSCSERRPPQAVLRNDHRRFKNVKGCFSKCSQSARSQAHEPPHLHVCIFNHRCLMSCTNSIMLRGCLVRHQVLVRVRERWGLISSLSATRGLSVKTPNCNPTSKSDYRVCVCVLMSWAHALDNCVLLITCSLKSVRPP